jgi:predicted metal-binding membrane protein
MGSPEGAGQIRESIQAVSAIARDRTNAVAVGALAAATAVAWVTLAEYEPPMGLPGFLTGWVLMMAAMMLPSIAPLVLLYRGPRVRLAAGYLVVWGAIGVLPFAAMELELEPALPVVLALAGAYELSPLKSACLRRCRNAAAFLMQHYRSGPLRLGVEHGLWCVGCCVGLMAVLVLAAAMGLGWAAALAAAVFAQKVLPLGEVSARLTGVVLLISAAVVAAV